MVTFEFTELLVYCFYIITTIIQLYFLWNISQSLERIVQNISKNR